MCIKLYAYMRTCSQPLYMFDIGLWSIVCICHAGSMSQQQVYPQAEATPDTRSMLVQEGDPPMGRPVILSKEANLLPEPPSASWGSAAGVTPALQTTGVQTGSVTGITSEAPTSTEVLQVCSSIPCCSVSFCLLKQTCQYFVPCCSLAVLSPLLQFVTASPECYCWMVVLWCW